MSKKEKRYKIKEIFYSIQGEGYHSGKPAIFIRFSGCNLWSGLEKERNKAICKFCDTDFVGTNGINGGVYTAKELSDKVQSITKANCKFVVMTGGEPLLQLDQELINTLHEKGYFLALETNGTIKALKQIDWITVSPKTGAKFIQTSGDELKIVYPQDKLNPADFEELDFQHFYLQPKAEITPNNNTKSALAYCMKNPKWKLSLQLHKILNIE